MDIYGKVTGGKVLPMVPNDMILITGRLCLLIRMVM
jgi:hypothetical protein